MSTRSVAQKARMMRTLRRYAINGLLIWVPVLVTVLVVRFILQLMDGTLLLLPMRLRPDSLFGLHIPGFGALLAVVVVLLTGLLVTNFIGRFLVGLWEELLEHIPFIRALYGGVKSFSETLLSNSGNSFKQVLLIEYPRKGAWSVGFQTTDNLPEINQRLGEPHVCVFIPTTPNPTSGFIVLLPRSQVIALDMSVDEAMKMIVTLGVVAPQLHGQPPVAPARAAP
ncbi:MAG: hypothetical protein RL684_2963 [Pseudomonadota bacterium]